MSQSYSTDVRSSRASMVAIPDFAATGHALLRIGAGLLFMQHGVQKLFGLLGGAGGSGAPAELLSQYGLAGVLEFFGGALIVVGLLTRPVAAVLALLMIVAYFIGHASQALFPVQNGGELALLYTLIFVYLAGSGSGKWSIDAARRPLSR